MSHAVGVDGYKDGWVMASATPAGVIEWSAHQAFAEVLAACPDAVFAVDIPIGTTDGPRDADAAARAFLSAHHARTSSVFSTATTHAVQQHRAGKTHAEAMADVPTGSRTSIQAWHLIPKMIEVADADRGDAVVLEAHPECSFRSMDPRVAGHAKKTGLGVGLRLQALQTMFAVDLATAPPDVPVDDLLDAAVLVWTARRYAAGAHVALGPDGGPQIVV